jgi:hypothetical protein
VEPLRPGEPNDFDDNFRSGIDDDAAEPERLDTTLPAVPRSTVRRLVLGAIAVGSAALVGATVLGGPSGESASDPGPTPTPTPSAVSWPSPREASPTPRWPSVFSTGGFLADLDLVVFARTSRSVYRIDTRAKRVTRTRIPGLESSDQLAFLATPDRVILRPHREAGGFDVVDGKPPRALTGILSGGGTYLPGPSGYVWTITDKTAATRVASLTDSAGSRVHSTVTAPVGGEFSTDGTGGLLYSSIGGAYQAKPSGLRRVTTGRVVATSRDRFLTVECDERYTCRTYLLDRRTDVRRRVASLRPDLGPQGLLSPDGRYAALADWGAGSRPQYVVVEVNTARRIAAFSLGSPDVFGDPSAAWLPDGRLLFLRETQVAVFDPRTRRTTTPTVRLPPLVQLALRTPSS